MVFPPHTEGLTKVALDNLENQQDWKDITTHTDPSHPRPLISGLPPRRMYIHPDEQVDIIKAEKALGTSISQAQEPEYEWVLPVHLSETLTLSNFAAVFDSIEAVPPGGKAQETEDDGAEWKKWRGSKRVKRVLLATIHDDSTVVYYMMHDGIVKPRQN
ncbi:putative tRNA-splicing endonuclease subunit tsp-1 [Cytospora mali]|uniref:tRNA-splicing endonuclease subunit tsp-1 n=1 Tax=Cytospora mali TaxID=578113 RepID=A0A194VJE4_CYTMA|nr:putative tRNA-splicing endonuclease subunit tsp-1 [Valsa mali]